MTKVQITVPRVTGNSGLIFVGSESQKMKLEQKKYVQIDDRFMVLANFCHSFSFRK